MLDRSSYRTAAESRLNFAGTRVVRSVRPVRVIPPASVDSIPPETQTAGLEVLARPALLLFPQLLPHADHSLPSFPAPPSPSPGPFSCQRMPTVSSDGHITQNASLIT